MTSRQRTDGIAILATVLLLPVGLAAAACATPGGGEEEEEADAGTLRVQVRNRNFDAVTIFGETPGGRIRVGIVGANDGRVFTIPWTTADDIRFLLRLENGRSCRSRTWYVEPGGSVTLTIASDFAQSPVCRGG